MSYDEFKRQERENYSDSNRDQNNGQSKQVNDSLSQNDSLEWAKEAYARLKQKQEIEKAIQNPVELVSSLDNNSNIKDSSIDNSYEIEKKLSSSENIELNSITSLIDSENNKEEKNTASIEDSNEVILGDFDDQFTWSAEVLAAQGRAADQISIEEIDWLGRLRKGLEKTRKGFVSGLLDKLGDDPLTPEVVDDLEMLLLRADAGVKATDEVLNALRRRLNEEVLGSEDGLRFLKDQLCQVINAPIKESGIDPLIPEQGRLNIWLLVGVNGVGKTTTLGKLANLAVRSGYSALIAAADTFRAAAVEQVQIWGDRSGVSVIANSSANADPAAVVFDAIGAAKAKDVDLLLVDTAGRLQTKHNLMEELEKVRRIIDKLAPEASVESLLVLDASQGQNGLRQAMAFGKAAGLTGVVITKLDGSSRGGVALAVSSEVNLPIRFIGAGEGVRDLRPFNSFEFVEALLANR